MNPVDIRNHIIKILAGTSKEVLRKIAIPLCPRL